MCGVMAAEAEHLRLGDVELDNLAPPQNAFTFEFLRGTSSGRIWLSKKPVELRAGGNKDVD